MSFSIKLQNTNWNVSGEHKTERGERRSDHTPSSKSRADLKKYDDLFLTP